MTIMRDHSRYMNASSLERSRVLAVLGPTNTGKTHFAVERMLAHRSGLMGFPLRLLAREIYDRIVALRGESQVALITGEEKRWPEAARYFIATTEAMPSGLDVAFLAIDEIQLCADPERGHVFTDRLLHARGAEETVFLGSETARPLLTKLVPQAEVITRPRFSTLSYAGPMKLTRMPRRSAVVAFSASDVYRLAEVIRRQKGGAAVVLGALSPRTRNAQVQLYQEGEVDYLVATDAIGMGLNMDLGHVAFAGLHKFDGKENRMLTAAELGQIAGRAGRHMRDGTFGTTIDVGGVDERMVEAVETHTFAPIKQLYWRNSSLCFDSLDALRASLEAPAPLPQLIRKRDAVDDLSFRMLSARKFVRKRAVRRDLVRLLWDVCQVPDFTKTLGDNHLHLLGRLYEFLSEKGRLPTDWVADKIARLDRVDGDIDTLMTRLAHIRTWSYVSHREPWLDDAGHWQGLARRVEDRLGDALHDRLTQRFVDRRTSALLRSLREDKDLPAMVDADGEVVVDGHAIGRMQGVQFVADGDASQDERRVLLAAARRVLGPEVRKRARALLDDDDSQFAVSPQFVVTWRGEPIADLKRGDSVLRPRLVLREIPHLGASDRDIVLQRLRRFLDGYLAAATRPLMRLQAAALQAPGRGLAYLLLEGLGNAKSEDAAELIQELSQHDRTTLSRLGVRFGVHHTYVPACLKPAAIQVRTRLWRLHRRGRGLADPPVGRVTLECARDIAPEAYYASGYVAFKSHVVRVDMLERVAARLRALARNTEAFELDGEIASLLGLTRDDCAGIVDELGYRRQDAASLEDDVIVFSRPNRRPVRNRNKSSVNVKSAVDADSPFAALAQLRFG